MGETGEYKLVLVVRTDLKMGKGKVAAQVSIIYAVELTSFWSRREVVRERFYPNSLASVYVELSQICNNSK